MYGLKKEGDADLKIADLVSEYNKDYSSKPKVIYSRSQKSKLNTNTYFYLKPYLASREGFLKELCF